MKKLNRKGFTLVELLAVIVILAIVVGITLVTVLPTLKKSRQEAFNVTAQTAADYLEKQYQLSLIGEKTDVTVPTTSTTMSKGDIEKAGLKAANYISATWYIQSNTGRACVRLTASTRDNVKAATDSTSAVNNLAGKAEAGEYYDVEVTEATSTCCTTTSSSSSSN